MRTYSRDMPICPVCGFPETERLSSILGRIEGSDLLVTLICDFSERVCDSTLSPAQAREWLRAARNWRTDIEAARAARAEAKPEDLVRHPSKSIIRGALWAATNAQWVSDATIRAVAISIATAAVKVTSDHDAEQEWQIAHTRALACTCPAMSPVILESRSRNSILTTQSPFLAIDPSSLWDDT